MADEDKSKQDEREQHSETAQPVEATGVGGTGVASGGQNGGEDERRFTQADIERIIGERLERERKKSEAERKKAEEQAEAARLKDQAEWQKLAEKHEKRVAELEAGNETLQAALDEAQGQAKRVEGALGAYLETAREGLPEHILALLDKLDVVDQLTWLAENRAAMAAASAEQNGKGKAPIPGTPKPDDGKAVSEQQRQDAQAQAARRYRNQF